MIHLTTNMTLVKLALIYKKIDNEREIVGFQLINFVVFHMLRSMVNVNIVYIVNIQERVLTIITVCNFYCLCQIYIVS